MSIDDRIRIATEATAATVREIRPLTLPDDQPGTARPARPHRRRTLGWGNWLVPLSAAVAVIAVAAMLIVVRDLPGEHHSAASGPPVPSSSASTPASTDGVPRYYVALSGPNFITASGRSGVIVGDDQTGYILSVLSPSGQSFTGVTGAADDRTFVLSSYDTATRQTNWYLLRITPGAEMRAHLTKLPIKPLAAQPAGLALSPDGRELAVMFAGAGIELQTYSVSSGALLGTWHTGTAYWIPRFAGSNSYGLSWLADGRHIEFRFDAYAQNSDTHLVTVRTLDVTAPGQDLLTDSRLVLQTPLGATSPAPAEPCAVSLAAPDGRTVICGAYLLPDQQDKASCTASYPSFTSYPTTGKPPQVLYRYNGQCQGSLAQPLWTDSSGSQVIGLLSGGGQDTNSANVFLIAAGHFTSLSAPVAGYLSQSVTDPGGIAF